MIWVWFFWLEVVLFSGYFLWNLFGVAQERPFTRVQWINTGIYTVALLCGLYGLFRLAARRWTAK
jgi:hypothetical protein